MEIKEYSTEHDRHWLTSSDGIENCAKPISISPASPLARMDTGFSMQLVGGPGWGKWHD